MFVEPGLFAGERGTLKTKIDTLLTETIPDMATFEQGTCLFAATVAFGFREIMQHHFETLVVFEDWFVEHGDEALGINIEVTQAFDEFGACLLYTSYIYSLHLTPKLKHLYSDICVIQKEAVSLNRSFRQTMNSQRRTDKRLF